ncbi:MAG TPA: CcmD family protein [Saprospiraceae bacterium]|nr:CcmD family protein [Saprospiraceae bacterium]
MHFKRIVCSLFFLAGLLISPSFSQVPIDDFMRSTGKIYVVAAVLAVIFLVIIGYLISLDRKIHNLEKKLPNGKKNQ